MASELNGGLLNNVLLAADLYKESSHHEYPEHTTSVYSYFESQGGKYPSTVFFGLQYILKRWLVGKVVTQDKISEAKHICDLHNIKFNEDGWKYIIEHHEGYLPLRIKAVPEGTVVPCSNVLFTLENTDPKCYWLTSVMETVLGQVWYPMSVATNSRYQKEIIAKYLHETADNMLGLPFKLHDFGFRGSTCVESAGIGATAHLVNFCGTDTIAGLTIARHYYSCPVAGFSIPAAEHSTVTSWGRNGEIDAFRNMLEKFPNGLVAVVSDSYDIWNACENIWGEQLKHMVVERGERSSTLVVRPDSGDPPEVVVKVLTILGKRFGTETNSKGFKMLPSYIRVIQGDGISYETLGNILDNMRKHHWSADNLAFGSGGALLQKLEITTQQCVCKCSYAIVNGNEVNVSSASNKVKSGRLSLEEENGKYKTLEMGQGDPKKDLLVTVFENGKLLKDYTFDEIRKTAEIDLVKSTQ